MKTALITGANQGLGYGFVEHLLEKGWKVFGGTRKITPDLPSHENLIWIPLELGSDESIRNAVEEIKKHTSALDLLVNNAGLNKDTVAPNQKEKVSRLDSLDRELLHKMFDINTIAPMLVLKALLPLLSPNPSFVINISSCRASFHDHMPISYANYGYRGSKAALNIMTHASVFDLPHTVRTFSVHPGIVHTSMNPTGTMEPKEQAKSIIGITESWNESKNGQFLNYDSEYYPL